LSILDTGQCNAVLFDLDGTLVDTAPDMVAVLQELQRSHGIDPVDYELGRAYVSNGALGLLGLGFPDIEHAVGSELHAAYLDCPGAWSPTSRRTSPIRCWIAWRSRPAAPAP
jgi:phosphoglycolate phosphatase-like HAD superfamily hydrolase